jgi:hypothetical protein
MSLISLKRMGDQMQLFYTETIKGFAECGEKIKNQSDLIKKLEDQLNKITSELDAYIGTLTERFILNLIKYLIYFLIKQITF